MTWRAFSGRPYTKVYLVLEPCAMDLFHLLCQTGLASAEDTRSYCAQVRLIPECLAHYSHECA